MIVLYSWSFTCSNRARQCTITPNWQNGCIFGSQDAWFHVPMLLSADTMNIFH